MLIDQCITKYNILIIWIYGLYVTSIFYMHLRFGTPLRKFVKDAILVFKKY